MRMRSIEIAVGAFMLAAILAVLFLAVRVSGINGVAAEDTYHITARFNNVSGLSARAQVTMSGVGIGRITDISVDTELGEAIVGMDIQSSAQLSIDTGAKIVTEGVLGGRYVAIVPGVEDDLLVDGDEIEDTQGALILEDLIGQFVSSMGK